MDTPYSSNNLRRYLSLAWHWAWLFVLTTVVASTAAFVVSKFITPIYEATTTVLVNEAPATKTADYTSILTSERLTQTYARLLTKQPVLEGVVESLGLQVELEDLEKAIQVIPVRDTQLIEVHVEDPDPYLAAEIANTMVKLFADQNQALQASRYAASKQSLETQLAQVERQIEANSAVLAQLSGGDENQTERDRLEANQAQFSQTYAYLLQSYEQVRLAEAESTSNIVQAEMATPAKKPIRPRTMLNTALAAALGLLLAAAIALLIESLDDTVSPDDVHRQLGLPVLGLIIRHKSNDGRPITILQPRSPIAEAFRSLRTNIQFASVDRPVQTLLVTSPLPDDGKSTVAANLSVIMAQNGINVALVEGDLRRPQVHKLFGAIPFKAGISNLFVQPHVFLDGSLQATEVPGLSVLSSGPLPPNPAELLGSGKMTEILTQVSKQASLVVIDTPPVLVVTDAVVLASQVDGVLLVVRPGMTKLAACKQAITQLKHVGANILGVVLNDVEMRKSRYKYSDYKGYYYTNQKYLSGKVEG